MRTAEKRCRGHAFQITLERLVRSQALPVKLRRSQPNVDLTAAAISGDQLSVVEQRSGVARCNDCRHSIFARDDRRM